MRAALAGALLATMAGALLATVAAAPALAAPCAPDAPSGGAARIEKGGDAVRIEKDGVSLAYRTAPARIAVGRPFALEVAACGPDGAAPSEIRVDAGMPAHGHGMNYTPGRKTLGPGHAAFDGLLFHMPGRWRIVFDVYDGESRTRLTREVTVGGSGGR